MDKSEKKKVKHLLEVVLCQVVRLFFADKNVELKLRENALSSVIISLRLESILYIGRLWSITHMMACLLSVGKNNI